MSIREEVQKLRQLQKVDDRIRHLETDIARLPKEVAESEADLKKREDELTGVNDSIEKSTLIQKRFEMDLKQNGENINKFKAQLSQVKTNTQYGALQKEITHLQMLCGELEEKILLSMEEVEELGAARVGAETAVAEAKEEFLAKESECGRDLEAMKSDLAVANDERRRAAMVIEKPVLARYEAIRKKKEGRAISRIERNACEACYRAVPPQRILEVKQLEALVCCEECGRILVWAG